MKMIASYSGDLKGFELFRKEIRKAALRGYKPMDEFAMRRLQKRLEELQLKNNYGGYGGGAA